MLFSVFHRAWLIKCTTRLRNTIEESTLYVHPRATTDILIAPLAMILIALCTAAAADPQPGDIFREYVWTGPWRNASGWQRVTDPETPRSDAQGFLPNPVNRTRRRVGYDRGARYFYRRVGQGLETRSRVARSSRPRRRGPNPPGPRRHRPG